MRNVVRGAGAAVLLVSAAVACGARTDALGEVQIHAFPPDEGDDGATAPAGGDDGSMDAEPTPVRDAGSPRRDAGVEDATVPPSDACEGFCTSDTVPPPRPIAPLSTATVTSQRPVLRWSLPPGEDGALVEICRDRGCTVPVGNPAFFAGSGTALLSSLRKGVYFWRLRGVARGLVGTSTSPVWEFFVGAGSAPVNASWGTTLDVDGDGHPDAVVGALATNDDQGAAYVYPGAAPMGPGTTPLTLAGLAGPRGLFGSAVASAGDVNGDGFGDLMVGARGISGQGTSGAVYVYLGGPGGVSPMPFEIAGPSTDSSFGATLSSAGDVNGDGYADVVIGAYSLGAAYLYLGGPNGLVDPPIGLANPGGAGQFGVSVAGAGDLNGDGFADVIVGGNRSGSTGGAFVYMGASDVSALAPLSMSSPVPNGQFGTVEFGYSVGGAGDVDGDGYADVVIGAIGANASAGAAFVYLGGPSGLVPAPVALQTQGTTFFYGECATGAGDVNGDGYGDVVVTTGGDSVAGAAFVYLGGPSGIGAQPVGVVSVGGTLGTVAAAAGDVNGDGFDDILTGAGSDGIGQVELYVGTSMGIASTPALIFLPPENTNGTFGGSVQ